MNETIKIEISIKDYIKLLEQEREKIQLSNKLCDLGLSYLVDSINEELSTPSAIDFLTKYNKLMLEDDFYYELQSSKPIEEIAYKYWLEFTN